MLEDKRFEHKDDLKYSDFNNYPHTVYATAFLVNGKLADYKIGNWQRQWANRTFRGLSWEAEIIKNKNLKLTCEYNQIIVKNDDEHNNAFDILSDWLDESFEKYKPANLKIEKINLDEEYKKILKSQIKEYKKTLKNI